MLALDLHDYAGAEEYCAHPDRLGFVATNGSIAAGPAETLEELQSRLFLYLLKAYLSDHEYDRTDGKRCCTTGTLTAHMCSVPVRAGRHQRRRVCAANRACPGQPRRQGRRGSGTAPCRLPRGPCARLRAKTARVVPSLCDARCRCWHCCRTSGH